MPTKTNTRGHSGSGGSSENCGRAAATSQPVTTSGAHLQPRTTMPPPTTHNPPPTNSHPPRVACHQPTPATTPIPSDAPQPLHNTTHHHADHPRTMTHLLYQPHSSLTTTT